MVAIQCAQRLERTKVSKTKIRENRCVQVQWVTTVQVAWDQFGYILPRLQQ